MFTFGLLMFISTSAFAEKDCPKKCNPTGSSNGGECCSVCQNVTCANPEGPDRCYRISDDGASACSANCSDHACVSGYNQPNPMNTKNAAKQDKSVGGTASGSPKPAVKPIPRKDAAKAKKAVSK